MPDVTGTVTSATESGQRVVLGGRLGGHPDRRDGDRAGHDPGLREAPADAQRVRLRLRGREAGGEPQLLRPAHLPEADRSRVPPRDWCRASTSASCSSSEGAASDWVEAVGSPRAPPSQPACSRRRSLRTTTGRRSRARHAWNWRRASARSPAALKRLDDRVGACQRAPRPQLVVGRVADERPSRVPVVAVERLQDARGLLRQLRHGLPPCAVRALRGPPGDPPSTPRKSQCPALPPQALVIAVAMTIQDAAAWAGPPHRFEQRL